MVVCRRVAAFSAVFLLFAASGCGSDEGGGAAVSDVADQDGIAADGAVADATAGDTSADDGAGSPDGGGGDTAGSDIAGSDIAGSDIAGSDTGASDAAATDTATSDATGSDATSSDASAPDAASAQPSCKGTLHCAVYDMMQDPNQCKADPGCTWNGKTCDGFAEKLSCDKAPGEAACKSTKGCAWTSCNPTNKGVETCDGVDNDCDGVTDNATTPAGAICDDGDLCTGTEVCAAGKCAAGKALTCAAKACHDASCDKAKGCVYTPNSATCDDNNPCTEGDTCAKGSCAPGKAKDCSDGDACTKDTCVVEGGKGSPATAKCQSVADGAAACDDSNPCTDDSCDPKTGCQHTNNTKPCDDGDACTGGAGGGKGAKSAGPLPGGDVCKAGTCTPGTAVVCNDGNACTDDSCDKAKGCVALDNAATCDDGNACTKSDACAQGTCKGAATSCDDKNVCTTDSCDAKTGQCSNTAVPGCKTCTSATQCNDNNGCTKDSCSAGKCVHAKISGCIGPTDYQVVSLVPKQNPMYMPGPAQWRLTVRNDGKPYGGTFSGKMTWTLYASQDNTYDAKDKKLYGTKWGGYNIGAPKKPESYVDMGVSIQNVDMVKDAKFVCVVLAGGGDKNLTNNTLCVPANFVLQDLTALSLTVPTQEIQAGSNLYVTFSYKNHTKDLPYVYGDFYLSEDNKLDDTDPKSVALFSKFGAIKKGQTVTMKLFKTQLSKSAQLKHKYFCFRINTYVDAYKKESNPNDNAVCAPIKVKNPPNIGYSANHIYFRAKTGKNYANVPYGTDATCGISQINNASYGDLNGSFPIRCWLSSSGKDPYGNVNAGWWTEWKWTGAIPGQGNVKTVLGTTYKKVEPTKVGPTYLCADMNHDKSLLETAYNNKLCRKIAVTGVDLFVDPNKTKFGATSWKNPQPSVLKRNVDYLVEYIFCNQGNVTLNGKAKGLRQRMVLSKDKVISADDFVIWKTDLFQFSSLGGLNQYGKPSCASSANQSPKVKIPTTVAAGTYYLLFDVNADERYPEPMANNLVVKSVTVQ